MEICILFSCNIACVLTWSVACSLFQFERMYRILQECVMGISTCFAKITCTCDRLCVIFLYFVLMHYTLK